MFGRKKNKDYIYLKNGSADGERIRVCDLRCGPVSEQTRLWERRDGNDMKYEFECKHCHGLLSGHSDAEKYFKGGKENEKVEDLEEQATREYILIVGLCPLCLDREMTRREREQRQNDPASLD